MITVLAAIFLLAGSTLALTAAMGIVRFPDLFSRMHAATKPQTLGILLILLGLALRMQEPRHIGMLAVVAIFQLLTAPVSAHMIGRTAYRTGPVGRDRLAIDELSDDLDDGAEDQHTGQSDDRDDRFHH